MVSVGLRRLPGSVEVSEERGATFSKPRSEIISELEGLAILQAQVGRVLILTQRSFAVRFTYDLDSFKRALAIKECFSEKNPYECKIKKEYGNKAYQEKKDIDALYLYTQVRSGTSHKALGTRIAFCVVFC